MLNKKYGYIYITTNLINGKIYIGQHIISNYIHNKRYKGSGKILKLAFKKYGYKNFKTSILEYCDNQEQLNNREQLYIKLYKSQYKSIGYNLDNGGTGKGKLAESTKRYGDKNSSKRLEVREKISKALTGRHYIASEESKFNHKIASYKRYQKLEEREKAREIYYRNGMDKISKGRIWITNGHIDKMIYPKDLENYVSLGYKKGRIIRKNKLYLQNR